MNHYGLLVQSETGLYLTAAGEELLAVADAERDADFARHIITRCGGFALIEAIQQVELRGGQPTMEDLNEQLGEHPTSKSISGLKAWLQRAGVLRAGARYAVDAERLEVILVATTSFGCSVEPPPRSSWVQILGDDEIGAC